MKGRSSEKNLPNPFIQHHYDFDDEDYLDEKKIDGTIQTNYIYEYPKKILSKNDSPDIPFTFSINPYQGCEHGCAYCYARNTHSYWGLGTGLDFESKIVVKRNAAQLLEKAFLNPRWRAQTIALSGNTDCYQPAERKFQITRGILRVCQKYGNPVGVITKNSLVTRDLDVLSALNEDNLVSVIFSITTLDENLRRVMEPRTATAKSKLLAMEELAKRKIPVGVMMAPIIPGLNDHEIENVLRSASMAGAWYASYTSIRLNGQLGVMFESWLDRNFPDRKEKVLNKIKSLHGGQVNDNRWSKRMRGDGELADLIAKIFKIQQNKYFGNKPKIELRTDRFRKKGNLSLF